jgi:adenylate kinase family enzyme
MDVHEAEALDAIVAERDNEPLIVVNIVVPQDELVRRLSRRRICSRCGGDADAFDGDGGQCSSPAETSMLIFH